jgi:2-dehydropantoate 2-reductase
MHIAIMGTGGLGAYFGGRLAQAGQDVTFIARGETLRALRQNGLQVYSAQGDFTLAQVQATDQSAEVGPVDLVLFCVKAYGAAHAIETMRPLVGAQTSVLPVLNGIDHISQLQRALGEQHVLGGLAWINAHKVAPGVVEHITNAGPHQIVFGEWAGGTSPRCAQIADLFVGTSLSVAAVPNIAIRMWQKFAAICGGGGVFTVLRSAKGQVWTPETKLLLRDVVAEAIAVAQAQGVPLSDSYPDELAEMVDRLPATYKPSMLVDLEHGRRLEVGATNGVVVRLGQEAGVPTPLNRFIYACLQPYANGALSSTP